MMKFVSALITTAATVHIQEEGFQLEASDLLALSRDPQVIANAESYAALL